MEKRGNRQRKFHRDETKTTRPKASYRFSRDWGKAKFLAGKSKEGDCREIFFPPRERKVERRIDFYWQVRGGKISLDT